MAEYERKGDSEQLRDRALSGHDEPVVVDNGPATVLFGKKHTVTSTNQGKTWMREEVNNFSVLYIQEEAANGEVTHIDSWKLDEITMIRVTLENGEAFEFTLVTNSGRQDLQMISATTGLDRDTGNGRLKLKNKNVVVTRVEGFKNTTPTIKYTPVSNPKAIKVAILPVPEKP